MIDGVNSSNIALEIPQALFNPPVEAVQEMRVQQRLLGRVRQLVRRRDHDLDPLGN